MTQPLPSRIPTYKVSIWETIAVMLSAIVLIAVGLTGLAMKFLSYAASPQRAEAIAKNIMSYNLPDGAQGLIGLNIAGAKVALVASEGNEPDTQLLVARIPIDQASGRRQVEKIIDSIALGADEQEFQVRSIRVEKKQLCGAVIPVTIREGQLRFPDSATKFTVTYRASVTLDDSRYVVNLLTNGNNAKHKASTVFDSLQCQQ
jgi:hypothetical protein